ncbi:MAG: hypothetical protein ACYTFI_23015 [Planctomycetota bacterium]
MAKRARKNRPGGARRRSSAAAARAGARLSVVPRSTRPDTEEELRERLERVRGSLYELYGHLRYFAECPPAHRARLRREIDWPDVGHITSLARSLAEEERFADWVRFNRLVKSA